MTPIDDLLNTAPCGFLSLADDGKIVMINASLLEILGYAPEELHERSIEAILPLAGRLFYQTHLFPLLRMHGKAEEISLSLLSKDGHDLPVLVNAVRRERQGRVLNDLLLMVMRRRNEYEDRILQSRKAAEEASDRMNRIIASLEEVQSALEAKQVELLGVNARLETQATTDELTGLKNHRAFQEDLTFQMALAQRLSTPLSLLLVDVDHFKKINDTFGHPVGDRYLKTIAGILKSSSRETDLVARYGGEEFILTLPNADPSGAMIMGEKLRAAVESARWVEVSATVSVGASTLSATVRGKAQLISAADRALYFSKGRGRNCVTHADDV